MPGHVIDLSNEDRSLPRSLYLDGHHHQLDMLLSSSDKKHEGEEEQLDSMNTDLVINMEVLEETFLPSCTNMDGVRQGQRRNVYEENKEGIEATQGAHIQAIQVAVAN